MHTPQDYRDFAILYVDDEAQALKYFKKAMEKDFEVITAGSAAEGLKVLEQSAGKIGILICDQRMPGEKGTELLSRVRTEYPALVRILTTAYSDLESAIEAVNTGAIYKYIVKPWDLRDLRGVLLRAMDFYLVQRQRDLLLREKLSVLQRVMVNDRIRGLAVLAAGLSHHIRNSMSALKAFLDIAPIKLKEETSDAALRNPAFWQDAWTNAQHESRRILDLVERVSSVVVHPSREFSDSVNLHTEFRAMTDKLAASGRLGECKVELRADKDIAELHADRGQVARLCEILLLKSALLNEKKGTVRVSISGGAAVHGAPGLRTTIEGAGAAWQTASSADIFSPLSPEAGQPPEMGLELLSAFFIAHHHGGEVRFGNARFELLLPADPMAVEVGQPDIGFLDNLFDSFYLQGENLPA